MNTQTQKSGAPKIHARVEHLLAALESELASASDAEIEAVAGELGMELSMKGSAAFAGVRYGFGLFQPDDIYADKRRAALATKAKETREFIRAMRRRTVKPPRS
jgi:hypothetical protein